jgi:hyperosmotically inducible protein
MKSPVFPLFLGFALIGCDKSSPPVSTSPTYDKPGVSTTDTSETKKDNTRVNQRDQSEGAKTPIDQNENQKDIDITASIRKRVVEAKLSTNAENSKIITQDGKVTLRGPVKTEDEKKQIEAIATDIAGSGNVDSQLEVQP